MENNSSNKKFNDNETIVFKESQSVSYGSKLPTSSNYLTSELSTSLNTVGNIVSGISDTWLIKSGSTTRLTGTLQPYNDNGNPAADATSSTDSFFTTGSNINVAGEGFTQPLWSKTKIEIDISSNPCSFKTVISQSSKTDTLSSTAPGYVSGSSFQMAYYNFDLQVWEGIGTGWPLQGNNIEVTAPYGGDLSNKNNSCWRDSVEYGTIGFNAGILNFRAKIVNQLTSSVSPPTLAQQQQDYANHFLSLETPKQDIFGQRLAGMPTDSFGFPYAPKFHATSSQVLSLASYIDKPFLLEKVVVEISGAQFTMFDSVNTGGNYSLTSSVFPATINNFFILNQRNNTKYSYRPDTYDASLIEENFGYEVPSALVELTANSFGSQTRVSTTRDIITFAGITGYTNDLADYPEKLVTIDVYPSIAEYLAAFVDITNQTIGAEIGISNFLTHITGSTVSAITQSHNILSYVQRDSNIHISQSMSSSLASLSWDANIQLNIPVRSPNSTYIYSLGSSPVRQNGTTTIPGNHGSFANGTSNGLGLKLLSSRRLKSEIKAGTKLSSDIVDNYYYGFGYVLDLQSQSAKPLEFFEPTGPEFYRDNPYIVFPEDNLVFGWQLPIPQNIANPFTTTIASVENRGHYDSWAALSIPASGSNRLVDICEMSFNGPGKVILYGSYVSNNSEDHATHLEGTNSIHEVIG